MFIFTNKKGGTISCGNLKEAIRRAEKEGKPEIFHKDFDEPVAVPFWTDGYSTVPYPEPGTKYQGYSYNKDFIKNDD